MTKQPIFSWSGLHNLRRKHGSFNYLVRDNEALNHANGRHWTCVVHILNTCMICMYGSMYLLMHVCNEWMNEWVNEAYYISLFFQTTAWNPCFFQCHNALTNLSKKQIPSVYRFCRDLYRRFILILTPACCNLTREIKCLRSMGHYWDLSENHDLAI